MSDSDLVIVNSLGNLCINSVFDSDNHSSCTTRSNSSSVCSSLIPRKSPLLFDTCSYEELWYEINKDIFSPACINFSFKHDKWDDSKQSLERYMFHSDRYNQQKQSLSLKEKLSFDGALKDVGIFKPVQYGDSNNYQYTMDLNDDPTNSKKIPGSRAKGVNNLSYQNSSFSSKTLRKHVKKSDGTDVSGSGPTDSKGDGPVRPKPRNCCKSCCIVQ